MHPLDPVRVSKLTSAPLEFLFYVTQVSHPTFCCARAFVTVLVFTGIVTETDFVNDPKPKFFVMEAQTFDDLCANLSQPCICCGRWKLHSKRRVGCMCSLSIVVIMIVFFYYVQLSLTIMYIAWSRPTSRLSVFKV